MRKKQSSLVKRKAKFWSAQVSRKWEHQCVVPFTIDDLTVPRKTVRGMVPFKKPKGKSAYSRLKVFMGVPMEFKDQEMITFDEANSINLRGPHFTLGELATEIGW